MPTHVYRASTQLDASSSQVWSVLSDFEAYPSWNPFTREVLCTGRVGEPVKMRVQMGPILLRQSEILREITPPTRLVWAMDIGLDSLLAAERVQTLTPLESGGCLYATVDTIEGFLSPLVHLLLGRWIQEGFDGVVSALAEEVPRRVREGTS